MFFGSIHPLNGYEPDLYRLDLVSIFVLFVLEVQITVPFTVQFGIDEYILVVEHSLTRIQ
jgi:hypothetical protein